MNDIEANNLNINCLSSKNNNFNLDSDGNLIVKSISTEVTNNLTIDDIYPIGSIYFSINNVNPSNFFGGIWEQIKDKFLLSSGDTYKSGSTGGESNHILDINEIPRHNHTIDFYSSNWSDTVLKDTNAAMWGNWGKKNIRTAYPWNESAFAGKGLAHNNMPPYLTVNVFKRIA